MSNNLGRTEVNSSQTQKETAINNSDAILDAAITEELVLTWSGETLRVLTSAQLCKNQTFIMTGTPGASPVLKMAANQRGMVMVDNDLGVELIVTDNSTAEEVVVKSGQLAAIYVTATGVRRIFEADSIVLPADTSLTVRVATTANITISTALNSGDNIDGITLADGDRVLVKDQTTGSENGIYVVGAVPARATDFDDGGTEVYAGVLVTVEEGTVNADTIQMLSTNNPITVGSSALVFKALNTGATEYATNTQVLSGSLASKAVDPAKLGSLWVKGSDIASASTITIGNGRYFHVTGTTSITDIDWSVSTNGREAILVFDGVLTLTHNATSLILPGGASITTAAGDRAAFVQDAGNNVVCLWYQRADGTAVVASSGLSAASTTETLQGTEAGKYVTPDSLYALWGKGSAIASASLVEFDEGGYYHITGTTTINDFDFTTAKNGRMAVVVFDGVLTITYNATTLLLPGGTDITTAAGDTACFVQDASDNIICLWYQRADGTPVTGASFAAASTSQVLNGTNTTRAATPDAIAALWEKGSDVASAGTVSFGEGGYFHITGTTTITDIDWATTKNGRWAWVVFDGILTLTHNATTLILPGGASITTAAGDRALFVQDASDNVVCLSYQRADGTAVVSSGVSTASTTEVLTGTDTSKAATPNAIAALWEKGSDIASAGTISIGEGGMFHVTGTTTITDIDWATAHDGRMAWLVFDGVLTLTHNSTTLKLPTGANITTAAGDRALFIQDNSDNVICLAYIRADGSALVNTGANKEMIIACSDETTLISTGNAKATFRAPRAMTLTGIKASLTTAHTSGTVTIDVNLNGATIMTTNKLNFDANEKTTVTYSGTAATLTTTSVTADDEFTIDFDAVGSGGTPAGVKVTLLYT
jgi:hypothetical protein